MSYPPLHAQNRGLVQDLEHTTRQFSIPAPPPPLCVQNRGLMQDLEHTQQFSQRKAQLRVPLLAARKEVGGEGGGERCTSKEARGRRSPTLLAAREEVVVCVEGGGERCTSKEARGRRNKEVAPAALSRRA